VKPDALDAADAEERKTEVVLQVAELPLYGSAALVERCPLSGTALDRCIGLNPTLAERDHRGDAALVALCVDAVVVVARTSCTQTTPSTMVAA